MSYSARSHVAPGDVGTANDQNQGMDNEAALWPYTVAGQVAVASSTTALAAKTPGWNPDAPPASPGSIDDEFSVVAGGVPTGWTEYDGDNKTTWAIVNGGAKAVTLTNAGHSFNGIAKALPAGAFSVMTKVGIAGGEASMHWAGICLWENVAGDNDGMIFCVIRDNTASFPLRLYCGDFTTRSGGGGDHVALFTAGYSEYVYLRVRRTGTNYYFDFSFDGRAWRSTNGGLAIPLDFTPGYVGLGLNNNGTGLTMTSYFQFLRYVASDLGLTGAMDGARF